MALTYTQRFGLPKWNDPSTDGPTHTQFNSVMDILEQYAAHDDQGNLADRPAAGRKGNYYWAIDVGVLYRDTGTAWVQVGQVVFNHFARNATATDTPLIAQAQSASTGDIFSASKAGVTNPYFRTNASGISVFDDAAGELVTIGDAVNHVPLQAEITATSGATGVAARFKAAMGWLGHLTEWISGSTVVAFLDYTGLFSAQKLRANSTAADSISTPGGIDADGSISADSLTLTGGATVAGTLSGGRVIGNGTVPTGGVIPFGGTAVPFGWLLCNGQSVSRTTYANLFAAIGTTYGSTSSTTFKVPDLTSRVPLGSGGTLGAAMGATTAPASHRHSLSDDGQAQILVTASDSTPIFAKMADTGGVVWTDDRTVGLADGNTTATPHTTATGLMGFTDSTTVLPPYSAVNYIIKT